jgi:hypothetical protein
MKKKKIENKNQTSSSSKKSISYYLDLKHMKELNKMAKLKEDLYSKEMSNYRKTPKINPNSKRIINKILNISNNNNNNNTNNNNKRHSNLSCQSQFSSNLTYSNLNRSNYTDYSITFANRKKLFNNSNDSKINNNNSSIYNLKKNKNLNNNNFVNKSLINFHKPVIKQKNEYNCYTTS